jgi:hypothetical protein
MAVSGVRRIERTGMGMATVMAANTLPPAMISSLCLPMIFSENRFPLFRIMR